MALTDLPRQASWAVDYLAKESAELGEKAARQAVTEDSLAEYEADDMNDDPVRAMARDSWDFFYTTVVEDALESLKPPMREGLPPRDRLLDHLFEDSFLPAVRRYLDSIAEDD